MLLVALIPTCLFYFFFFFFYIWNWPIPSRQKSRERSYRKDTTSKIQPPFCLFSKEKAHFIIGHATSSPQNTFYVYGPVNWPITNDFMSRVLLKQATKKKNEGFITRRFGVLMTPSPSEMFTNNITIFSSLAFARL